MSSERCAVFDLDGTLIDSAPDLHVAANRLLAEEGQPPLLLQQIEQMVGEGVSRLVDKIFGAVDIELSATALDHYTERFRALYLDEPCRLTTLYPGARACLDALAQDATLALCTNKPLAPTLVILERLGLASRFAGVVGGDSLAVRKPDPAPLLQAIADAGGARERTVFIGDSAIDRDTGTRAEVPVILVEGGYAQTPVTTMSAAAHARDLTDVPALARRLWAG